MSKATILLQVVEWLHNDAATSARQEEFWTRAKDAIAGDVYGVDSTVADWDLTHCVTYESLWFYACLAAAHVWARDNEGREVALAGYRDEVARVGTSPELRATTGQLTRNY